MNGISELLYSDSRIPAPPAGHSWKEVRHDNTVTWLASWTENVQGSCKYIMLNANSKLKVRSPDFLFPSSSLSLVISLSMSIRISLS